MSACVVADLSFPRQLVLDLSLDDLELVRVRVDLDDDGLLHDLELAALVEVVVRSVASRGRARARAAAELRFQTRDLFLELA